MRRYLYSWGNNERRAGLKGRSCTIEAMSPRAAFGSSTVLVRFLDNDERVTTDRRALRRA